jgi:phosphatidylethanolamine/phosphatidyl-N-methylethanolamine N-methyltransferase
MPISTSNKTLGWPSNFLFLQKFLRHGSRIASVAPSSRRLALTLCRYIDSTRPQIILELGAGTGAVTTVALERMHPQSTLVAVEMDADFAHILRRRCPEAYVIEADAAATCTRLETLGITQVDVVISGLPIPSLPRSLNHQIFTCIRQVAPESYFSQLTVMPWVYLGLYRRLFYEVNFVPVWWNIPCGGVYHCRYLRQTFTDYVPGKKEPL